MAVNIASATTGSATRLAALDAYAVLDSAPEPEFDALADLAASLCATPVALISFVGADRQWFKARVSFPRCETDLDSSVCKFALAEPDLLIIPDLREDPRTSANPLVAGEPNIRFYAGAPLRSREGEVLGSLCVIDTEPRPNGLTPRQANDLRRLARELIGQLELRRTLAERDRALLQAAETSRALTASEAHWRGLFENLREGFILARPVRDETGRITDWRYLEVNAAWAEMVGLDPASVIGRTVRGVLPNIEEEWVELASVVDIGETLTFTRQVGQLGRWYDGRASALGPDLFSVLFLEVTERVRTAQAMAASAARKDALAELGDHLRAAHGADAMSFVASSIMGRTLGACRAGYGTVDARREQIDVPPDWAAPGFVSVAGEHSFRTYGSYIEDLKQGRTVVVSDVASDTRTAGEGAAALEALGIRALVNSPILDGGVLASISFVHWDQPWTVTSEELAFIRTVTDRTQVGIARLRSEERQAVLNGEISHRLKNTLTMVQAMAAQTLKSATTPEALNAFNERLLALSRAQDVLMRSEWVSADIGAVVQEALNLTGARERYIALGPPVQLGSRAALSTSLLLHELATNAAKYGALTAPAGHIEVEWQVEGVDGDVELSLAWRERGGPPALAPTRRGFGSRLLRLGLVGTGGSELSFDNTGLSALFRAPLKQVEEA